MPVVIDEFEVVSEPPTRSAGERGARAESGQNPPDARPAELQQALEQWAAVMRERALRLDDR